MKKSNGMGSITKLKGNRRKPYMVRVTTGYTSKGEQIRAILGYYKNQSEAQQALSEFLRAPTTKINITLGQLYEEWSARHYAQVSKQMQGGYRAAWNWLRSLSNTTVKEIRSGVLQQAVDAAAAEGLGDSSLSKIKVLCTCLMSYAMENDIINKNYAEFIVLPKAEKKEKECFTDIDIKKMWDAYENHVPNADLLLIMCYTGFRITEFLQLTLFNYDAAAQTLTGGIKTDAGRNRVVPIFKPIQPLVAARAAMRGERLICDDAGKGYNTKYFREKIYYPALEAIGLPRLTPHATRHTMASILAAAEVSPVYAQRILGHANYQTTANVYTHVDLKGLKSAIEKLDQIV